MQQSKQTKNKNEVGVEAKTFFASVCQYLMPNGRVRETGTELPFAQRLAYRDMESCGCRFEAEVLRTGGVSVTIFHIEKEEDIDIEVIPNGPEVQEAFGKMLKRALWRR